MAVELEPMANGLSAPLAIASPPDDERLYVAERVGRVWRIDGGRRELALDVSDEISEGGEQGLLGLAFHPGFAANGRVFVDYTDPSGATRVREIAGAPHRKRLDHGRRRELLRTEQPEANHNGGHLVFGRDGHLRVGLGDGGGGAPEVHVFGLRNPWRFALDGPADDLWVADVGQNSREEVTRLAGAEAGGANLGWPLREGSRRNRDGDDAGAVPPNMEYGREVGCSITGGVVVRGEDLPRLRGRFLVGDYCTGRAFAVGAPGAEPEVLEVVPATPSLTEVRAFGTDGEGGVYAAARGAVYRLVRPGGGGAPNSAPAPGGARDGDLTGPTRPPSPSVGGRRSAHHLRAAG